MQIPLRYYKAVNNDNHNHNPNTHGANHNFNQFQTTQSLYDSLNPTSNSSDISSSRSRSSAQRNFESQAQPSGYIASLLDSLQRNANVGSTSTSTSTAKTTRPTTQTSSPAYRRSAPRRSRTLATQRSLFSPQTPVPIPTTIGATTRMSFDSSSRKRVTTVPGNKAPSMADLKKKLDDLKMHYKRLNP